MTRTLDHEPGLGDTSRLTGGGTVVMLPGPSGRARPDPTEAGGGQRRGSRRGRVVVIWGAFIVASWCMAGLLAVLIHLAATGIGG